MDNFVGYKLKLYPTKKQIHQFNKYFGYARFIYNIGITEYEKYHDSVKDDDSVKFKHLNRIELATIITRLKNTREDLAWMKEFDSRCIPAIAQDVILAYEKYFKFESHNAPVYKTRKNHWQSCTVRGERMSILDNYLYLPSFKEPILLKNVPSNLDGFGNKTIEDVPNERRQIKYRGKRHIKFRNARLIYNGVNYYITFSVNIDDEHKPASMEKFIDNEEWNQKPSSDIIGLDWGIKHANWYVGSNGITLERPDQTKLDKRIAGYQRKFSRQQRINNKTIERTNQYTKNELKTLRRWNKLTKKHTNQRLNVVHNFVSKIVESKPEAVVIEDVQSSRLFKNAKSKEMRKKIKDSIPYKCSYIIKYKCEHNGIKVIVADSTFKSTQLCSNCGHEQKMGSKKVYKCPNCGIKIDRDLNAAINLRNYGYNLLHQQCYI